MDKVTQTQLQEMSMPESDERRPNDQFDVPWKDILDAYFPDLLDFSSLRPLSESTGGEALSS